MREEAQHRLDDLAADVADGRVLDWDNLESGARDEDERSSIRRLRAIAAIGHAHAELTLTDTAADSLSARSLLQGEDDPSTPATWGSLRILDRVGRGRFGDVYRAWDPSLDREVALKLLRRRDVDASSDVAVIEEGRLMARVRHPNVVTIHGAQRIEGRTGLWMEFIDGRTLAAELRERGPFAAREVAEVGIQLCGALAAVHDAGLVHRDVKAQNVLRDAHGRVVLGDFGTGYELDDEGTAPNALAGTPAYLAPEIFSGSPAGAQSDLYSLGVLLFHLSTGRYPVTGRSLAEIRTAHAMKDRVGLGTVRTGFPRLLTAAIERAISPAPEDRYQSAAAMKAALTRALGAGVVASVESAHSRDVLLGLIDTIYAAPDSDDGWMPFLNQLGTRLGGTGATFISAAAGHRPLLELTTISRESIESYHAGWGDADPWRLRMDVAPPSNRTVILGHELVPWNVMKRTGYYAEFARQYDLVHTLIGVLEYTPRRVGVITVSRSELQGTFSRAESAFLQYLMPHLRRGLQLHARLRTSEAMTGDLTSIVDMMPAALFFVNARGRVILMNRAASRLVATHDGVSLYDGELCGPDPSSNASLRVALANAVRTSTEQGMGTGGTVVLGRPSGRRPRVAIVSPVSQARSRGELPGLVGAAALILIDDLDEVTAIDEDVLRRAFSLTPAEIRLANLLVRGLALSDVAQELGLSVETVRERLKSMLEKTNTSRRHQLVSLLLNAARG